MTNSNDDYQSINESYEMMIEFPYILKNNLDTMSEADIINFYKKWEKIDFSFHLNVKLKY